MARRLKRHDELGPAVPRWATEYRRDDWLDHGAWQTAVIEWADEHLRAPGHLGPWMDLVENSLRLDPDHGA